MSRLTDFLFAKRRFHMGNIVFLHTSWLGWSQRMVPRDHNEQTRGVNYSGMCSTDSMLPFSNVWKTIWRRRQRTAHGMYHSPKSSTTDFTEKIVAPGNKIFHDLAGDFDRDLLVCGWFLFGANLKISSQPCIQIVGALSNVRLLF